MLTPGFNKCYGAFCDMSGEKKDESCYSLSFPGLSAAARAFPALVALFRIESRDMAGLGAPPTLAEVLSSSPATSVGLHDTHLRWGPIDAKKSAEAGAICPEYDGTDTTKIRLSMILII